MQLVSIDTITNRHKYERFLSEEFEDTKGVIRIGKSKMNRQHNSQKKGDKQQSTKHYTEN
jgi:hypothetical protein